MIKDTSRKELYYMYTHMQGSTLVLNACSDTTSDKAWDKCPTFVLDVATLTQYST